MNIKFKNGPKLANLATRFKPKNAEVVRHPDGTDLYILNAASEEAAIDSIIMSSRFNKTDTDKQHLIYLYCEHIIDFEESDEKMFAMLLDDFSNWWKHIEEKLGTDDQ